MNLRIGVGTDVHAYEPGIPMMVAGLHFADEPDGLAGHSDGDVAAHAAVDALLAAAGLGDIGGNFGTDDPAWAKASGVAFLTETVARLGQAGYSVVNLSIQVIGQRPRMAARRQEAEHILTSVVGAPVSISGTTTDGLGLTGRGEGLAAIAVALVTR